ncbi:hypothetical protein AAVH_00773 [Aphelenchoides avenae]|nr:hypothetical protein AAVH_00773 [Aphelenchus avenae]
MKRQGQRQPRIEEYFGKRARVEVSGEAEQEDDVVVVTTGKTSLEMIAEAYDDSDDELEGSDEKASSYVHDATDRREQVGGAFGFSSSDEQSTDDDDSASEPEEPEGAEVAVAEDAPNGDLALEELFEVVDHRHKSVRKFGFDGYQTKFVLKDNERVDEPVEVLRHVLQRFIDEAMENSQEHGYSTDWIGISFITDTMKKGNGGNGKIRPV